MCLEPARLGYALIAPGAEVSWLAGCGRARRLLRSALLCSLEPRPARAGWPLLEKLAIPVAEGGGGGVGGLQEREQQLVRLGCRLHGRIRQQPLSQAVLIARGWWHIGDFPIARRLRHSVGIERRR